MKKILMILTSHRLDCFRLCIDMLVLGGSARRFDRVVILCSGVEGRHLAYVRSLPSRFPEVQWDFIYGARGRGKPISDMQNDCVRKYPDALYFKLDEDTYVSSDWDVEMERAYHLYKENPGLSLLTAVVTNNQRGAYHLLNVFPELGVEFTRTFNQPIIADRMGPIWILPRCAAFMIRSFLNLEQGNRRLREANRKAINEGRWPMGHGQPATDASRATDPGSRIPDPESRISHPASRIPHPESRIPDHVSRIPLHGSCIPFSYPFSINCLCYDYRHWQEIGGVPEEDENGWGKWIPENGKFIVLVGDALVHHYSFFVQQNWLDRSSLLEEIRRSNLPATYRSIYGSLARLYRILVQVPDAVKRRFKFRS